MKVKLHQIAYEFGKSTLLVLSNTVIMVPFLLFLGLSDGRTETSVLPFALYYACRILGVFLIRAIKNTISSLELLVAALSVGLLGSILALFGPLLPILYLFSGILIGLSASWLPSANVTLNHFQPNKEKKVYYPVVLVGLLALFWGLSLSGNAGVWLSFGVYTVFYIIALLYAREATLRQILINRTMPKESSVLFSKREFWIFTGLCLLLIVLRSGRLLDSALSINIALIGFCIFFLLLIYKTGKEYRNYQVPLPLNILTFLNGAVGNFLFLFGSLYVVNIFGKGSETLLLYVPYALGMVIALGSFGKLSKMVSKNFEHYILIGLFIGFIAMLFPAALSVGFFLLSYTHFLLNRWLNNQYFLENHIPEDQRILLKNTTQKKGSLIHQFFLVILMFIITEKQTTSQSLFLQLMNPQSAHLSASTIFHLMSEISIIGFLILIVSYFYLKYRKHH
ncbi:hypothetical protein JW886_08390 [Lactococcus taiwanensis]|uniref:Uncharacterized protein n=1 Tax=Lactococcus taiwanensis TaxID=1151742 RepID=A0AA45QR71_9LACT|nr:hypothetical protein [Lactococcus taiwanensis]QRZ11117.1 hypothetical protein JVB21_00265 [Lactococcus taiwanensis]QSE76470.1 hypothetical protein JW886_08390 [Lactococcus taiwanensis]